VFIYTRFLALQLGKIKKSISQESRDVSVALRYCDIAAIIKMAALNGVLFSVAFAKNFRRF